MRYSLLLAPLLFPCAAALADEIYVDLGGTGDTLSIQAAIDLAVDGDQVIIRPGVYPESVRINGKSLWLVAQNEEGPAVRIRGNLRIENIDSSQEVLLAGLRIVPEVIWNLDAQPPALSITDSEGMVRIQDAEVRGADGSINGFEPTGGTGVFARGVRRLTLVRTEITGGKELELDNPFGCGDGSPGIGLYAIGSSLAGWDAVVRGGDAVDCGFVSSDPLTRGGDGVLLASSSAFLSGSSVFGGRGSDNQDVIPVTGGDGGDGVRSDAASRLILVDTTSSGGIGGGSGAGGAPGATGMPFVGDGQLRMLSGAAELRSTSRYVLGQSVQNIRVEGKPGTDVVLYISERAPFLFDAQPGLGDVLPTRRPPVPLGTIPASGVLNAELGIPALPPTSTTTRFQFVIVTGQGAGRQLLASPVSVLAVNCGGLLPDCNANGRGDLCDLIEGVSVDVDGDGIPDDC